MLLLLLHMPPVQYSAAATPWAKALNTTVLLFVLVLFFNAEVRRGVAFHTHCVGVLQGRRGTHCAPC